MTQLDFCTKFGISQSYLSEIENRKKPLTNELYGNMLTLLGEQVIDDFSEDVSDNIANGINYRIRKIIEDNFNGSMTEFCNKLNLSQAVVKTTLEHSKPSYGMLMSIIGDQDIRVNMKWLLIGEGEPYKIGDKEEEEKQGFTTYLLPMSAMGGSLTGFADQGVALQNCEAIVSPIENVDFAITVYGESMAPEYPSGSRILIKKVNPDIFIDWGKVYVLDTPNGVVVKEVHESIKEGCISCHSINSDPKFRPFDVLANEIFGMYRVLMCLSAK